MKSRYRIAMMAVMLTVIPVSSSIFAEGFDDSNSGLFSNDDQNLHRWIELGNEIQLRYNTIDNKFAGSSSGTIEFSVRQEEYVTEFSTSNKYQKYYEPEILGTSKFHSNSFESPSKIYSHPFVPKQIGSYSYDLQVNYDLPEGKSHGTLVEFFVVEKFSKTYSENNGCRDGFKVLMKNDFSTIVCVTHDSASKIKQRGGWGPL